MALIQLTWLYSGTEKMSTVSPSCDRGGTLHCWMEVSCTLVSSTMGLSVSIELVSRELDEEEKLSTC